MSPRKSTMKRKNGKKMKGGGWFDWVPSLLGSKPQQAQTPAQPQSQAQPQAQPQDQKLAGAGSQPVTRAEEVPTSAQREGMTGGRKRKSSKRKTQKNKSR